MVLKVHFYDSIVYVNNSNCLVRCHVKVRSTFIKFVIVCVILEFKKEKNSKVNEKLHSWLLKLAHLQIKVSGINVV